MSERNGELFQIPDGYTRDDGYIARVPRLHPALRFSYRPALVSDRSDIFRAIRNAETAREGEQIAARATAARVLSWNVTTPKGEEVEPNADEILRLSPELNSRLFQIVMGTEASDEIPGTEGTTDDAALEAAITGQPLEEVDAKN